MNDFLLILMINKTKEETCWPPLSSGSTTGRSASRVHSLSLFFLSYGEEEEEEARRWSRRYRPAEGAALRADRYAARRIAYGFATPRHFDAVGFGFVRCLFHTHLLSLTTEGSGTHLYFFHVG